MASRANFFLPKTGQNGPIYRGVCFFDASRAGLLEARGGYLTSEYERLEENRESGESQRRLASIPCALLAEPSLPGATYPKDCHFCSEGFFRRLSSVRPPRASSEKEAGSGTTVREASS